MFILVEKRKMWKKKVQGMWRGNGVQIGKEKRLLSEVVRRGKGIKKGNGTKRK